MTDVNCLPACAPNIGGSIPPGQPPRKERGDDCLLPLHVRLCNPSEFDTFILCDPANANAKVAVVTSYTDAGVPTSIAYNLNGTLFAGTISTLVTCGTFESDAIHYCQTLGVGAAQTRTTLTQWVVKDQAGRPTGDVFWSTILGAVVVAPDPLTVTTGACSVESLPATVLIYMQTVLATTTLTMAQIVAATSATIHSVTVKQITGIGRVTGATGNGVDMDAGETWSWSAVVANNRDTLGTSLLSLAAGAVGQMRVTVTYVA